MKSLRTALALVGLVALPTVALLALPAGSEEHANPHGRDDACGACHQVEDGEVGAPLPVVQTCRGCHPTADMHPVGMPPEHVRIAEGFPLEVDGTVTCATCHAEPAHGEPVGGAPWFRGGPHDRIGSFCARCHEPERLTRWNPHHADGADPRQASCSACHTRRPRMGVRPEQANLRLDPAAACATCHPAPPHQGVVEHVGREVSETILPLADGRIACFTCHDVHREGQAGSGVALAPSPLADALHQRAVASDWHGASGVTFPGAARERASMLRLPLEQGRLCAACHGEGP